MKLIVPFYSNTADNTHCFQAVFKMVLKYFLPEKEFSWEELEKITAKVDGLWTWPTAGILWMKENGFETKDIESFDFERFISDGGKYLIEEFGEEVGNAQIFHSDIKQERELAKKLIKYGSTEKRIPTIDDIKNLFREGYLIMCNVNSKALNSKEGYSGHAILIIGFDKDKLIVHDPGLLPIKDREVPFEIFEKAWAYPQEKSKNIIAFRLKIN